MLIVAFFIYQKDDQQNNNDKDNSILQKEEEEETHIQEKKNKASSSSKLVDEHDVDKNEKHNKDFNELRRTLENLDAVEKASSSSSLTSDDDDQTFARAKFSNEIYSLHINININNNAEQEWINFVNQNTTSPFPCATIDHKDAVARRNKS